MMMPAGASPIDDDAGFEQGRMARGNFLARAAAVHDSPGHRRVGTVAGPEVMRVLLEPG